MNYLSGPGNLHPTNHINIASLGSFYGVNLGDQTRVFGSLTISNGPSLLKMGHGFVNTRRGSKSHFNIPLFNWLNTVDRIKSFTLSAQLDSGENVTSHVFCSGSGVKVLGRNF